MRAWLEYREDGKPYFQYIPFRLLSAVGLIRSHMFRLNQVKPDPLYAVAEVKHACGAVAQVHDAISHIGAAVIDPDDDPLAILEVGHLDEGSQRQRTVCSREFEHVEVFAAGRGFAVKLFSIPGGGSYLEGLFSSFGCF